MVARTHLNVMFLRKVPVLLRIKH